MASYTAIFVTMCAVYIVLVKADPTYEFVTEKPDDYPNFDDNPVIKRLAQSGFPSRVKREMPEDVNCSHDYEEKLCCAKKTETIPYVIRMRGANLTVVQSPRYFTQSIQEVNCSPPKHGNEYEPCFSDFRNEIEGLNLTSRCKPVQGTISVLVYEHQTLKFKDLSIGVECSCFLE